jgi:hypothetical protein
MADPINVRFKNKTGDDINFEALHPGGFSASGSLNEGEHYDFMVYNGEGLVPGDRQITVSTEFPQRIKYSNKLHITHDYTLVNLLPNIAAMIYPVGSGFPDE